ncbi:MAG: glycoside hydrolase family 43 protein [Edaphobacter sp.]|uniref:glycoside hydrolase family 43 protein n=1 Tax=Edaphobacter sp. TaxID=1934404 RepID=UPI0023A4F197|nr:glycoside hydrolase family 43 protein [Edaphobacter sp.]MDE1178235.1 glycoside hydrolase family 43 protein [Edaphobacter sp.]
MILFGAIGLAGMAYAQAVNPILPHADPFITYDPVTSGGQYVLTATGRDITLWSGPTPATASATAHVIFTPKDGMTQTWSPTVWKMDGHWWVYFTAQMPGEKHKIYVLQSDTDDVLSTYTFKGALETGRQSIDPSLLIVGKSRYLMYVTVDSGANDIHIRKLKTPMEFDGEAALIAHPEAGWEKGEGSTRNYPVDEGPTALYHNGKTFIVFSASDTASPRYCLGLLTLTGRDPMLPTNWKKTPHPVFEWSPENGIYGPGRGTFSKAKDGSMWLLYAAKTSDAPNAARRETRAQRFTWNADDTPNFGVPEKDGPIKP